ncbi:YncE family protein [Paenibacillus albus]|uniref:YncE family protein n=1 Tax=Paenibacillus albus TaxID=2495582 RepID=A0A3S9A706_9BACL|nr:hypothetical protein [Paenibacillus albus]AZN41538.1 hypothetical protein EJC50_19025 [Paenibacillus albus]
MPNFTYIAQSNSKVTIVDIDTFVVVSTIVIGFNTNWIALTPDGKMAYLANQTNSTVALLDLMSEMIVEVIYLGITDNQPNQPKQIVVHPTNGLAYIANASGTISIIDTAVQTLISTVKVASTLSVMALSPDKNYLLNHLRGSMCEHVFFINSIAKIRHGTVRRKNKGSRVKHSATHCLTNSIYHVIVRDHLVK